MGIEARGGTVRKKLGELLCERAYLDEAALNVAWPNRRSSTGSWAKS
jgi:hypothetical protein